MGHFGIYHFHCHAIKNYIIRNRSMKEANKMTCYERLIHINNFSKSQVCVVHGVSELFRNHETFHASR